MLPAIQAKLSSGQPLTDEETTALRKLVEANLEPFDMSPARIEIRCRVWEKNEIERRARKEGKTATEYILDRALTDNENEAPG